MLYHARMKRTGYILKASCKDTTGIVAAVTGFLAAREALILELTHFVDEAADKSFIRVEFEDDADTTPRALLDLLGRLIEAGYDVIKTENLYTFDGTTQRVYSDGEEWNSEAVTLDIVEQVNRLAKQYGADPHGDAEWVLGDDTSKELKITTERGGALPKRVDVRRYADQAR